ncbi:MAG: hypothetical protein ACPG4Z_07790, partial [Chitinophagales bacterium]
MKLWNRKDKRLLKQEIAKSDEKRVTLSFYQYAKVGNPQLFRDHLFLMWDKLGVMGRTYVAH